MSARNDGGPAFPSHGTMGEVVATGMSLRDYFAVHASDADVQAMLPHVTPVDVVVDDGFEKRIVRRQPETARQIARYMHADLMLKAREA